MASRRLAQSWTLSRLLQTQPGRIRPREIRTNTTFPSRHRIPQGQAYNLPERSFLTTVRSTFRSSKRGGRGYTTVASEEKLSLSQRLRKLSREYGWSALGVYFFLSALDFPFCFLAVRMLGTDRIGHWEHVVVSKIKEFITWPLGDEAKQKIDDAVGETTEVVKNKLALGEVQNDTQTQRLLEEKVDTYPVVDHGLREAQAANSGANATLWTQLVLAYAIHKSFIFIRVPLTAAVTPKVVKTLRSWGWNIGKRPASKAVVSPAGSTTGVNTKGAGVKRD